MPPKATLNMSFMEPFILDEGSDSNNTIYNCWLVWVEELDIYLLAAGVLNAPQKKAILLHLSVREIRDSDISRPVLIAFNCYGCPKKTAQIFLQVQINNRIFH